MHPSFPSFGSSWKHLFPLGRPNGQDPSLGPPCHQAAHCWIPFRLSAAVSCAFPPCSLCALLGKEFCAFKDSALLAQLQAERLRGQKYRLCSEVWVHNRRALLAS